jgi:hypothetical protein
MIGCEGADWFRIEGCDISGCVNELNIIQGLDLQDGREQVMVAYVGMK